MSSRLSGHDFDVEKPGVEFEGADSERYCDCIQGEPRGIQSGKRENAMALSQGCLYLSRQPEPPLDRNRGHNAVPLVERKTQPRAVAALRAMRLSPLALSSASIAVRWGASRCRLSLPHFDFSECQSRIEFDAHITELSRLRDDGGQFLACCVGGRGVGKTFIGDLDARCCDRGWPADDWILALWRREAAACCIASFAAAALPWASSVRARTHQAWVSLSRSFCV